MSQNITPQQAYDRLKSGDAVLIDVRSPDEFKSSHIAYALSLPLDTLTADFSKLDIPSSRTLIFQCLKGKRGEMACAALMGKVEHEILNIEGGIDAWKAADLPTIGGDKSGYISIFRQVQMIAGGLIFLFVLLGWGLLAALIGAALFFAGLTGFCGLAILLAKAPWNK